MNFDFITDFFNSVGDILRNLYDMMFEDWNAVAFMVWVGISLGTFWVSWFAPIPSFAGDSVGMPTSMKIAMPIILPIATWWMIANKERTADTFRGRRK